MSRYTFITAGAGLGGLAAAALLARRNRNVLLIDPNETAGGTMASAADGFSFSPATTLTFGFERGGTFESFCSDLGISLSATVLSPCYQVALPDRRVNVYHEQGETLEELRREFPREIDALVRFYRDVRKKSARIAKSRLYAFRARHGTSRTFLSSYRFSAEARAFLDLQALAFFQRPAADLPLASLAMLFDTTPLSVKDGFQRFAGQVLSSFLQNGGEILYGVRNVSIIGHKGKVQGIAAPDGRTFESDHVLLNTPPAIPHTTVYLGVRDDVLPVGMAREVICLPAYGSPECFFTLTVSPPEQDDSAPAGMRAVTASFPLLHQGTMSPDAAADVVGGLIPFLKRFTVVLKEQERRRDICPSAGDQQMKPFGSDVCGAQLHRTSTKHLYLLRDDRRAPLCAVDSARKLVERFA